MGMYILYCGSVVCATSVDRDHFFSSLFMFNNVFLRKCIVETPLSFFRVSVSKGSDDIRKNTLYFEECDKNGEKIFMSENNFIVKYYKLI